MNVSMAESDGADTADVCCDGTESYDYRKVARYIWSYGGPCLAVLGITGNILSAIVMLRKNLRQNTSSIYLLVLAFLDTIMLLFMLGKMWILAVWDVDVTALSSVGCSIFFIVIRFVAYNESWVLVLVAIERFVAVWWPLDVRTIFTRKLAIIQVICLAVVLGLLDINILWTIKFTPWNPMMKCQHDETVQNVWDLIDAFIATVIPFVIMIVCSVLIVVKLMMNKFRRASGRGLPISSITIMLMSVCITFIVTTLPIKFFGILMAVLKKAYGCCFATNVLFPVGLLIHLSNYAVNFLLYCANGSKFRAELKEMFGMSPDVVTRPVDGRVMRRRGQQNEREVKQAGPVVTLKSRNMASIEPQPTQMATKEPHSMEVAIVKPQLCDVATMDPQPGDIATMEPQLGDIATMEPQPCDIVIMEPQLFDVATMEPQLGDVEAMEPQLGDVEAMEPQLGDVEAMEPQLGDVEAMEPQLGDVEAMKPQLCDVEAMKPQLHVGDVEAMEPQLGDVEAMEPQLGDVEAMEPQLHVGDVEAMEPQLGDVDTMNPQLGDVETMEPQLGDVETM